MIKIKQLFLKEPPKIPLLFFTQIEKWKQQYILYKITKKTTYEKIIELSKKYKQILIDPGVHELLKKEEYSNIDLLHKLAKTKLPKNVYISIDYPSDMLKGERYDKYNMDFINKTNENNFKYKDNDQYICAVQFKFKDIESFKLNMELLEPIWAHNTNKIIGMGNMCRLFSKNNQFIIDSFKIIENTQSLKKVKQIHIYGLGLYPIKLRTPILLYKGFNISVDSTKWTRAINNDCRKKVMEDLDLEWTEGTHGYCACNTNTREFFFKQYIKNIKTSGIKVEY